MFWKIYFWLILLLSLLTYLTYPFFGLLRILELIDIIIVVISFIGLYCFVWKKDIFRKIFWKLYVLLYVAWNIYYQFLAPIPDSLKDIYSNSFGHILTGTINSIIFLPVAIALFLYAFKDHKKDLDPAESLSVK